MVKLRLRNSIGSALILVMVVFSIVSLVTVSLLTVAERQSVTTLYFRDQVQAEQLAIAGLEIVTAEVEADPEAWLSSTPTGALKEIEALRDDRGEGTARVLVTISQEAGMTEVDLESTGSYRTASRKLTRQLVLGPEDSQEQPQ